MERNCNECAECCYLCEIREIKKPPYTNCFYQIKQQVKNRCLIPEAKPKSCEHFLCAWMRGFGSDADRPDNNGAMISINIANNGTWIFIIETKKDAVITTAKNIIIDVVEKHEFPAIISSFGSKPPNDFGDLTVIKQSLFHRCDRMRGDLIEYLDENKIYGVYKLRK
jgi:hypothetical protein